MAGAGGGARLNVEARVLVALALAAGVFAAQRLTAPRPHARRGLWPGPAPSAGAPGTAFVFTSALCGACDDALAALARERPELARVALRVEAHPALVRALRLTETPTTFVVAKNGEYEQL